MLIAGFLVYGVGAGLTLAFDVRMYVRRWRLKAAGVYLPSPRDCATASVGGTRRSPGMSGARRHPG